jgi:hypothetical protein
VKRVLLAAGIIFLVIAIVIAVLLPPRALPSTARDWQPQWAVARGAHHVHSIRSDGTGTPDEIAAAAASAGLQFVILTDHGNGTRAPEPPVYRSGVLLLDSVEISTDQGHYIALGMKQTPYPLAGHVRDVIDDVRTFGGVGIAAHPGSPKMALRWTEWDTPFDGLEWLNADSEWRDESAPTLVSALLTYPLRQVETLVKLLDAPRPVLAEWDRLTLRRRVPALAGADAHARIGLEASDPYEDRVLARMPSYDVSFRAFSNHLILDQALTGDAPMDADLVINAIREGHAYTVIDGLAELGAFQMVGGNGTDTVMPGQYLDVKSSAVIDARLTGPAGTTLVLTKDGQSVFESDSGRLTLDVSAAPGAYRIEARLRASANAPSVPWLLTNPIYVGLRDQHARVAAPAADTTPVATRSGVVTGTWRPEASAGSSSTLAHTATPDGIPALEWRFSLAGGVAVAQYAAIRFPMTPELARHTRVQLRARSDQPRRLWIQLRAPEGRDERWVSSIYVDQTLRAFDLRFADFRPMGSQATGRPPLERVDSLILVIDTLNTVPGTSGVIWIPDLWLAR